MNPAAELKRKAVHIAFGPMALALAYLVWWQAAGLALAALAFNALLLPRWGGKALYRDADKARGYALGILSYPIAVLGLILVFRNHLHLAAAVWGILAFGDGFATVAGVLFGRRKLPWNPHKSWTGTLAYWLFGTLGAALLFAFVAPPAGGYGWRFIVVSSALAALAGALAESYPTGVDDNLTAPVFAGLVFYSCQLAHGQAGRLLETDFLMRAAWGLGVNILIASVAAAVRLVAPSGIAAGLVVGTLIYAFAGPAAFAILLVFFGLGTLATKWGFESKRARGLEQENRGRRGAKHAWANCGVAAAAAVCAYLTTAPLAYTVLLVAALATALADTLGSEIGQLYGRRAYLVTTWREVPPGTDGAVSVPGTLAGMAGALILGVLGWGLALYGPREAAIVAFAGFFGTSVESVLGATLQVSTRIDNEFMNFTNTLVGGLAAVAMLALFA